MAVESIGCIQDGSLIREAQGGNRAAFAQLMQTYDQAVLQLLRCGSLGQNAMPMKSIERRF